MTEARVRIRCRRVVSEETLGERLGELRAGEALVEGDVVFLRARNHGLEWCVKECVFASQLYKAPQNPVACAKAASVLFDGDLRSLRSLPASRAKGILARVGSGKTTVVAPVEDEETARTKRARRRSCCVGSPEVRYVGAGAGRVLTVASRGASLEKEDERRAVVDGRRCRVEATYPVLVEAAVFVEAAWTGDKEAALSAPPPEAEARVWWRPPKVSSRDYLNVRKTFANGNKRFVALRSAWRGEEDGFVEALWPGLVEHGGRVFDEALEKVSSGALLPRLAKTEGMIVEAVRKARDAAANLRYAADPRDSALAVAEAARVANDVRAAMNTAVGELGYRALEADVAKFIPADPSPDLCLETLRLRAERVDVFLEATKAGVPVDVARRLAVDGRADLANGLNPTLRARLAEPRVWTATLDDDEEARVVVRVVTDPDLDTMFPTAYRTPPLAALERARDVAIDDPAGAADLVACLLGHPTPRAALSALTKAAAREKSSSSIKPEKKDAFSPLVVVARTSYY